MPRYVLGPSFGNYVEPSPILNPEGEAVVDNLRVFPGGAVTVRLAVPPGAKIPVAIYAFFLTPAGSVPIGPDRTPEFFFASDAKRGSTDTRGFDGQNVEISVPGIAPGSVSFVQIVLEYEA